MTPSPAPLARALAAYGAGRRLNQNPADVLLLVHEELARELWSAKGAYEQKRLDQMCRHTERCAQILFTLRQALEAGAQGAQKAGLLSFYDSLSSTLMRLLNSQSVSETLQQTIQVLRGICSELNKSTSR